MTHMHSRATTETCMVCCLQTTAKWCKAVWEILLVERSHSAITARRETLPSAARILPQKEGRCSLAGLGARLQVRQETSDALTA